MKVIDYEWRTFDPIQVEHRQRIMELLVFRNMTMIDDYLLSLNYPHVNIKFRDDEIKMKVLHDTKEGIEEWESYSFRLPQDYGRLKHMVRKTGFPLPCGPTVDDILKDVPDGPDPELMLLRIPKKRSMRLYQRHGLRAGVDLAEMRVFENQYATIGIEAKSRQSVEQARDGLGFNYHPKNYIQFLSEIIVHRYERRSG